MTAPTPEPIRAGDYAHIDDLAAKAGVYTERHIVVLVGARLRQQMGDYCTPDNLYVLSRIAAMYDDAIIRQPREHGDRHKQRKADTLAKAGEIAIEDGGPGWTVRVERDGHCTDWVVSDLIQDWTVNISTLASKASRRQAG